MAGTIPKKTGFGSRNRTTQIMTGLVVGTHTIPTLLTFAFAQAAAQYQTEVEISVCNKEGQVIPGTHVLDVYLSDDVAGAGVSAVGPSGAVAAKAASGTVLGILTAAKAFRAVTLATGKLTMTIQDDVTPVLLYVAATIPGIGKVQVSRKTVAGDYKP
jgi:hypothetical protein